MKKIAVVGEDKRSYYLKKIIEKDGILEKLENSDYVFHSIPFSKKENLEDVIKDKKNIITGNILQSQKDVLKQNNICYIDLLEKENFVLENAKITAESIIIPLVNKTERRLGNEKILVLGYGKIAKHILKIFKSFSPKLSCYARKEKYKEEIEKENVEYIYYDKILEKLEDTSVIINTVPENIITNKMLKKIEDKKIIYLELASKPYGIDLNKLTYFDIDFLLLSGLPSKVMPLDAAMLIKKEIDIILKK